MVNTRQFSGSTYMQDMTKSHTFSAKNQGSTYTPIRLIRREIRYPRQYWDSDWGMYRKHVSIYPSGTADSKFQTAPVVGTKCFYKKIR